MGHEVLLAHDHPVVDSTPSRWPAARGIAATLGVSVRFLGAGR